MKNGLKKSLRKSKRAIYKACCYFSIFLLLSKQPLSILHPLPVLCIECISNSGITVLNRRMFSLCLSEADIKSPNGVHRKLWITATGRISQSSPLAARLPVRLVPRIAALSVIQSVRPLARHLVRLPANHFVPRPAAPACPVSRPAVLAAIPLASRGPNASLTARQAADQLSIRKDLACTKSFRTQVEAYVALMHAIKKLTFLIRLKMGQSPFLKRGLSHFPQFYSSSSRG